MINITKRRPTKTNKIFTFYNAKNAAIEFTFSLEDYDYDYGTEGSKTYQGKSSNIFLSVSKTKNPNIDMRHGIQAGQEVFDWANAIKMKLEEHEAAVIAKLFHPYYFINFSKKTFIHRSNGKMTTLILEKQVRENRNDGSKKNVLNVFICSDNGKNKQNIGLSLDEDQCFHLGMKMMQAMNIAMVHTMTMYEPKDKDSKKTSYPSQDNNNYNQPNYDNNYNNSNKTNYNPNSYRSNNTAASINDSELLDIDNL